MPPRCLQRSSRRIKVDKESKCCTTACINLLVCSGCEYVIALTHMRTDNDVRLAEKVPEVNMILGGHSLVYEKRKVGLALNKINYDL